MNKLLLAISATFLLNSTMAQAAVETFNFTFSGAASPENINSGVVAGFISFDTDNFVSNNYSFQFADVIDFGMTISGTDNFNGSFEKSNFNDIYLTSPGPLDLSREFVGQVTTNGTFGVGPRLQQDYGFWLFGNSNNMPGNNDGYLLFLADDPYKLMQLTSFAPASVAAVPEADTSAMLLTGLGVVGLMARRRKNTQA
jgi:hypothetical protein